MLMRRILLFVSLVLVAAGLYSVSKRTHTGVKKIRVGYIVKMPEERWFQDEHRFARMCGEKYGFEVITIGANDGEKVLAAIDNLASQGVQGFVICTPDARLGPAIMARANAHGMKVIAVDDQFVGADGKFMLVPYMGIAARTIGESVGKALFAEFRKRGWKEGETAAAAITFDELYTVRERTDGAAAALVAAGFPPERIFRSPEKTTDVPGAFDAANTLLTQHPEVKRWLVFSVNDEGALGAVRAMENHGFGADRVIGIGIGGSSAIPEFEKEQPTGFFATCLLSPYRHGFEATELLYHWIKDGTEPPMDTRTVGTIIDRSNYIRVMNEQGLLENTAADSTKTAPEDTARSR